MIKDESKKKTRKRSKQTVRKTVSISKKIVIKILLKIFFCILVITTVFFSAKFTIKKLKSTNIEKKTILASAELIKCRELVTVKTLYTDVITLRKTRIAGLARSFAIVRYTGTLRAGISDIENAQISVLENGKKVTVQLPPVEVLGNDISKIEVFDEVKNIFVSVSAQEIVDEINVSRKLTADDLIANGLLEEAKKQSILTIENMLYSLGFKKVEVK